jgi:hypothetical protein
MTEATWRFPTIEARSLDRETYDLPSEFEGRWNVAVVAFRREQQQLVDTWLPFLLALEAGSDRLRVYEIPVLARRWTPARRFIDGGMAMAIGDRDTLGRTLTSYTDVGAVQRALGLPDDSTIATVLTDRDGLITWIATGGFSERAGQELTRALEATRSHRPPH